MFFSAPARDRPPSTAAIDRRPPASILLLCLLTLAGCAQSDDAWQDAQRTDTPDGYTQYLQAHPKGERADQARARRDALVDERDWGVARRADSVDGYAKYLAAHPDGVWSELAQRRRNALASAAAAAPAGSAAAPAEAGTPAAAAAPPAVAAPAAAVAPVEETIVQLGAFSSARSAREGWEKLRRAFVELQGLSPLIDAAPSAGSSLYRLRLKFDGPEEAERVCAVLVRGGAECIPSK